MIKPATQTLDATEFADEMAPNDDFRTHLGASTIGRECAREIWYSWRWFTRVQHSGRIKRLFQRGHREEPIVLESLYHAGVTSQTIDPATGKQYRFIGYKGHEGGSGDGFLWNVPDVPVGMWCLFECKTHNAKSFARIKKEDKDGNNLGLLEAKPEHYGQCQRYMMAWGLQWCLYVAVCKDNDERYMLLIPYVEEHAAQMAIRAQVIIESDEPPKRISEQSTFYKCTYCDQKAVCHNGAAPERNCRTCVYAKPVENGEWQCRNIQHPVILSKELQSTGCANYEAIR